MKPADGQGGCYMSSGPTQQHTDNRATIAECLERWTGNPEVVISNPALCYLSAIGEEGTGYLTDSGLTKMSALDAVSQTCFKSVHKFEFELITNTWFDTVMIYKWPLGLVVTWWSQSIKSLYDGPSEYLHRWLTAGGEPISVSSHPGQLNPAIPKWLGTMSISKNWGVSRSTM